MQASQLKHNYAWLANPGIISIICGALAFVMAAIASPPPALVVTVLSLPFFYYTLQSRWKDCVIWIIITSPFQYYFSVGTLALTHTELYLFTFVGIYFLSRVFIEKSILLPVALAVPALYGLSQFTSIATGYPDLAKHGVRTIAVVFFCPQWPGNGSLKMNLSGSWASLS